MGIHVAPDQPENLGTRLPEAKAGLTLPEGIAFLSFFSLGVGAIEYARTSGQRGGTYFKAGAVGIATAVSLELPNFARSLPDLYDNIDPPHPSTQR